MARHEFKIFCPERPGPGAPPAAGSLSLAGKPGPAGAPAGGSPGPAGAPARQEPRPGGEPTGEERRGHAERRDGSPDHDREQFWALFVPKRSRS